MSTVYKSRFTGAQIDNGVELALNANKVAANTGEATTEELDTLRVADVNYEIPKPIDVEANPSTVGETNLENLKVGNTVYKIPEQITPTVVKANPSADATTDLTKLQVGTTVYGIPEGGTEVVANPTETGTTDLTSLKVDGTVYNIPSGGSTEDALAGTWVFNDALSFTSSGDNTYNVNFVCNSVPYTNIRIYYSEGLVRNEGLHYGDVYVYNALTGGGWSDSSYKTIEITSKLSEVTNGDTLLTWLQANATKRESGGSSGSPNFYVHEITVDDKYIGIITRDSESYENSSMDLVAPSIVGSIKHRVSGSILYFVGIVYDDLDTTAVRFFSFSQNATASTTPIITDIDYYASITADTVTPI